MSIVLPEEATERLVASIKRYFTEHREEEIGDLQAQLLLDFIVKEIGPSIYNAAITDAQTYVRDRIADLDGACFEPEFTYWPKSTTRRPSR